MKLKLKHSLFFDETSGLLKRGTLRTWLEANTALIYQLKHGNIKKIKKFGEKT